MKSSCLYCLLIPITCCMLMVLVIGEEHVFGKTNIRPSTSSSKQCVSNITYATTSFSVDVGDSRIFDQAELRKATVPMSWIAHKIIYVVSFLLSLLPERVIKRVLTREMICSRIPLPDPCVIKDKRSGEIKSGFDDNLPESELPYSLGNLNGRWWKPSNTHLMVYTVPRYPENHNPLLPLRLQQQLDNMNPREFLTYVLKELTLEERESLMVDERQRRKTFLVSWPYDDQRSGIKMAQAGFYSLDDYDRVQCVFCRGSLHKWDSGDTPMIEHARSFTFCRFVKGLECGNREYRSDMLSENDVKNITRFQNPTNHERQRRTHSDSIDSGLLGISTTKAALIRYAPDATRLRTFARWPASCPITARRMCDAGFYYTGFDDQVRCFYCSGGIKHWGEKDDPWEEHAKWFPECAFLVQEKGQPYVDAVHAKTPSDKKSVRKTQSQKTAETRQVDDKRKHKDMRDVCLQLGHSTEAIDRVLVTNGKPFDSINDMIDALYNNYPPGAESNADQANQLATASQPKSVVCPEEDLCRLQNLDSNKIMPGAFDGNETRPRHKMACRKCELTTESFVPATHIGLPCGHLIYCKSCNNEEKRKSSNSNYVVKCPTHKCGAPLTGSIRVYLV